MVLKRKIRESEGSDGGSVHFPVDEQSASSLDPVVCLEGLRAVGEEEV